MSDLEYQQLQDAAESNRRDRFACAALQALLEGYNPVYPTLNPDNTAKMAEVAFLVADAMLEASKR